MKLNEVWLLRVNDIVFDFEDLRKSIRIEERIYVY